MKDGTLVFRGNQLFVCQKVFRLIFKARIREKEIPSDNII